MMELTVPKNQIKRDYKIYYVTSESKPGDQHIVVRKGSTPWAKSYYCDCRDFMIRHLHDLSDCKHTDFVRTVDSELPDNVEVVRAIKGKVTTVPVGSKY